MSDDVRSVGPWVGSIKTMLEEVRDHLPDELGMDHPIHGVLAHIDDSVRALHQRLVHESTGTDGSHPDYEPLAFPYASQVERLWLLDTINVGAGIESLPFHWLDDFATEKVIPIGQPAVSEWAACLNEYFTGSLAYEISHLVTPSGETTIDVHRQTSALGHSVVMFTSPLGASGLLRIGLVHRQGRSYLQVTSMVAAVPLDGLANFVVEELHKQGLPTVVPLGNESQRHNSVEWMLRKVESAFTSYVPVVPEQFVNDMIAEVTSQVGTPLDGPLSNRDWLSDPEIPIIGANSAVFPGKGAVRVAGEIIAGGFREVFAGWEIPADDGAPPFGVLLYGHRALMALVDMQAASQLILWELAGIGIPEPWRA